MCSIGRDPSTSTVRDESRRSEHPHRTTRCEASAQAEGAEGEWPGHEFKLAWEARRKRAGATQDQLDAWGLEGDRGSAMTNRLAGWVFGLLVLLGISVIHAPARAQSEEESLELARASMERGQQQFLSSSFEDAAASFLEAYGYQAYDAFLYNAAIALERAGFAVEEGAFDARISMLTDAVATFERYIAHVPEPVDADEVRARLEGLRAQIASLQSAQTLTPPCEGEGCEAVPDVECTGEDCPETETTSPEVLPITPPQPAEMRSMITVRTEPLGARVSLFSDGAEAAVASGASPFAQSLDEGRYRLRIEHPDYEAAETDVRISAGTVYVVIMNLSQGEFLGYLRVQSDPPGARVFVNDRSEGSPGVTPYSGALPIGSHRIWVERPGYETVESTVELGIGEHVDHQVSLERVGYGRIRVTANLPDAEVFVDDRRVGRVPWQGDVDVGAREVRVESDGQKDWVSDVLVQPGQLTPVRVRLREGVPRGGAWAWLITGVVVAGAGGYLAYEADAMRSDLELQRASGVLANDDPRIGRSRWYSIGANGGFGLGGLFGAMSLYSFLRDPLPDSEGFVLEPRDWGDSDDEGVENEASDEPDAAFLRNLAAPEGAF